MKRPPLLPLLAIALCLAAGIGLYLGKQPATDPQPGKVENPAVATSRPGTIPPAKPVDPNAWQPPTGDPQERYRTAKTTKERIEVISNFIVLGHDRNVAMLRAALNDPAPEVQVLALESGTSLPTNEAHQVLTAACTNTSADLRERAWSLLASYPIDLKAVTFANVLVNGPDGAFDESFNNMSIAPERPVFETMLAASAQVNASRSTRLLAEMQEWLERAGEVPKFKTVPELVTWWSANQKHYDQYLLRTD